MLTIKLTNGMKRRTHVHFLSVVVVLIYVHNQANQWYEEMNTCTYVHTPNDYSVDTVLTIAYS